MAMVTGTVRPSTSAMPDVARTNPISTLMAAVFPEPFGPMSP